MVEYSKIVLWASVPGWKDGGEEHLMKEGASANVMNALGFAQVVNSKSAVTGPPENQRRTEIDNNMPRDRQSPKGRSMHQ